MALRVACSGERVSVTVRDTGVGISPEALPRLFELFTQVDRSTSRSANGLGIGLALVHRPVGMHGGHVFAHSDGLGKGSTFIVVLATSGETLVTVPTPQ
jgi:signal transduction histidine kinase